MFSINFIFHFLHLLLQPLSWHLPISSRFCNRFVWKFPKKKMIVILLIFFSLRKLFYAHFYQHSASYAKGVFNSVQNRRNLTSKIRDRRKWLHWKNVVNHRDQIDLCDYNTCAFPAQIGVWQRKCCIYGQCKNVLSQTEVYG